MIRCNVAPSTVLSPDYHAYPNLPHHFKLISLTELIDTVCNMLLNKPTQHLTYFIPEKGCACRLP